MDARVGQRSFKTLTPQSSRTEAQTPSVMQSRSSVIDCITQSLEDNKADDLVVIDLKGKTAITDTMVIASGRSNRHVGALADHLVQELKKAGAKHVQVEGLGNCDWVLVDAGDAIVHIFRPEVRAFYRLERLWTEETPELLSAAH